MARSIATLTLAMACGGWLAQTASAAGQVAPVTLASSRMVQGPNCVTAAPAPTCATPAPSCATPAPACTTPAPTCATPAPPCCPPPCCPKPCIIYRHKCVCRAVCCGCTQPAPISITLNVKNPCTCCPVEIPLCIPGCTTGEPTVCNGTGIFCRPVVTYTWANGYMAKVSFKHNGDVIVTTYGS
jgi:hypothetical protein